MVAHLRTRDLRALGYQNDRGLCEELRSAPDAGNLPAVPCLQHSDHERDPGPDGVPNNADDPGTTPTTNTRRPERTEFAGTTLVDAGNQIYKTIEVAGTGGWLAAGRRTCRSPRRTSRPVRRSSGSESQFGDQHQRGLLGNYHEDLGGYILPWDIVASANFERRMGDPQARNVQSPADRPSARSSSCRSAGKHSSADHEPGGFPVCQADAARRVAYARGAVRLLQRVQRQLRDGRMNASAPTIWFRRASFCRASCRWA